MILVIAGPIVRAVVAFALDSDFFDPDPGLDRTNASGKISLGYEYYLRISGIFVLLVATFGGVQLPHLPRSTGELSEAERRVAVFHLAESCQWPRPSEYENQASGWRNACRGLAAAGTDTKIWLLVSSSI